MATMYCKHCKKEVELLVGMGMHKGEFYRCWYCSECKEMLSNKKLVVK